MSELISGKEALIALANGERIEVRMTVSDRNPWIENMGTYTVEEVLAQETAETDDCCSMLLEFRLKPRTITINGIEVPACGTDYKPHTFMFVLNSLEPCEYSKIILDESDEMPLYWWKSEEEIKQVVAALRKIFVINNQ